MATERYTVTGSRTCPRGPGEPGARVIGAPLRRQQGFRVKSLTISLTIIYTILAACDPMHPNPLLRFGSDGAVRVTVEVPLQRGLGWMQQVLAWNSDGAWKLYEEIGYDSVLGDDNVMRNPGLPYLYAANYSSLIQLAIDNAGTRLWEPPDKVDDCGVDKSRISILIRDNRRDEVKEWARCAATATGLGNLSTAGFEPDDGSARVIQIALRARDFTVGEDFDRYAYAGSLPFATIDRGTQPGRELNEERFFRSPDGAGENEEPEGWAEFWEAHTGGDSAPPEIDWVREMVVVAAVGMREFTGDSLEVRRVLRTVDVNDSRINQTRVEAVMRVPGDYCTPERRNNWPYHIVVAPKGPESRSFSLREERIPCEA